MGARHRPRDADRDSAAASPRATGATLRELARGPRLPGARHPRRPRQDHAAPRRPRAGAAQRRRSWRSSRGAGHFPHARKPVQVNLALRDFAEDAFGRTRTPRDPTVYRPDGRPRALFISSPIGLGHAQRDVAIARELRRLHPDLQIDWLAQDPVTRVLEAEGERIHPASRTSPTSRATSSRSPPSTTCTASRRCGAWTRSSPPTSCSSTTSCASERYDLWIGDEAWELDYYLHENPREKRVAVRLADRLRRLPADGRRRDARESFLTADYNARDGRAHRRPPRASATWRSSSATPTTSSPSGSAPELPMIRDWTERNFDFTGYVTGFDPADARRPRQAARRARLRRRRAGLHRHRRRLGRRRRPAAAGDRRLPARQASASRSCG